MRSRCERCKPQHCAHAVHLQNDLLLHNPIVPLKNIICGAGGAQGIQGYSVLITLGTSNPRYPGAVRIFGSRHSGSLKHCVVDKTWRYRAAGMLYSIISTLKVKVCRQRRSGSQSHRARVKDPARSYEMERTFDRTLPLDEEYRLRMPSALYCIHTCLVDVPFKIFFTGQV